MRVHKLGRWDQYGLRQGRLRIDVQACSWRLVNRFLPVSAASFFACCNRFWQYSVTKMGGFDPALPLHQGMTLPHFHHVCECWQCWCRTAVTVYTNCEHHSLRGVGGRLPSYIKLHR